MTAPVADQPAPAGTDTDTRTDDTARVDPGQRGTTRITERAAERVATRAVEEVDLACGIPRQVFGMRVGAGAPSVDATVDGEYVTVRVSLAVRWPASVRDVTRLVRDHVTERLETLTGLRVAYVDIDVPALVRSDGRRVG